METEYNNHSHDKQINQQHQEDFQSFSQAEDDSSHQKQLEQSTQVYSGISGIEQSYTFSTQKIQFPVPPEHFLQLYEIYKSNTEIIKDLKTQISSLQQIKRLNQKLQYDDKNFDIQECIDLDEQSEFYVNTKKLYEQRQKQIEKLNKQYKQINSQQLQTLMLNDEVSKVIVDDFLIKHKQIIDCKCYKKFFVTLSLQKRNKRRKLIDMEVFNYANLMNKKQKNQKSIETPQKQSKTKSKLKAPSNMNKDKSSDKSQKSEDQLKSKQTQKYIIRCIYYNELIPSLISQGPHILPIVLPNHLNSQPLKISIDQINNMFILLMNDNSIQYFQMGLQVKMMRSFYDLDVNLQPILLDKSEVINFIESRNGLLYVGNTDGILRVYELQMTKTNSVVGYKLINIYGAFIISENFHQISHYSFPVANQNQIFFVGDGIHLCSLNILTFRSQKIKTFEHKIIKIESNIIRTTNSIYLNYCSGNTHDLYLMNIDKWRLRYDLDRQTLFKQVSQGKIGSVFLKPNEKEKYQKMQKQQRQKCQQCKIVGIIRANDKQIAIFDDQNGYFSAFFVVESIQQHQMN